MVEQEEEAAFQFMWKIIFSNKVKEKDKKEQPAK